MIEIYQPDDLTLASDLEIPNYQAGQDSGSITVHLWNAKDDSDAQTIEPLLLVLRTEDPTRPGVYLATGVPPQDELWGRARVIGFNHRGDAAWSTPATDWAVLGGHAGLLIASIPADCAVYLELRFHPPTSAQGGTTWRHRLVGIHSEHSQPIPPVLTAVDRGILKGIGDPKHSGIVHGFDIVTSNPPDDQLTVAPGQWVHRGRLHGQVTQTLQLDQVDGGGEALEPGESYWVVITLGKFMTITKGTRDVVPTLPTPPPGELFLRSVRVDHQPGGASVIEPEDLDGETIFDRYLLIPSAGLEARIHAGQALAGSTWRFRVRPLSLDFEPNITSYIWQLASGAFEITTEDEPPKDNALGPLWEVETDAQNIVAAADRRIYAGRSKVITLKGTPPASVPGEIESIGIEEHLTLERVAMRVHGNGTSGETVGDVLVNGESIFVSQGEDDQRPQIPFDAGGIRVVAGVHERTVVRPGDVVSFAVAEVASGVGGVEVSLIVTL